MSTVLTTTLYINKEPLIAGQISTCSVKAEFSGEASGDKEIHIRFDDAQPFIKNMADIRAMTGVVSAGYINGTYWIRFTDNGNGSHEYPINIQVNDVGVYTARMWVVTPENVSMGSVLYYPFSVRASELEDVGFTRVLINSNWTSNMGDLIDYTVGHMIKYTLSDNNHKVVDYGNNYRIGVYNSSSEYVNDLDEFLSRVIWCSSMAGTSWKEVKVKFKYHAENPFYIVYSHGYFGDPVSQFVTLNVSEPLVAESTYYIHTNDIGHALWPITALLNNQRWSIATMTNKYKELMPVWVYDFNDEGLFSTDISPVGISVFFDYESDCVLWCKIGVYLDGVHQGSRDVVLPVGSGTIEAGNGYDLFGLAPSDFLDHNGKFMVRVTVLNTLGNSGTVNMNNVRAVLKYINVIKCGYGFSVDGERSIDYSVVLTSVDYNVGTNNEISSYHVTGTDETIINRENINVKDISLTVVIPGCDIKNNVYLVDRLVELFTNDRELQSNKPIPKKLILEYMPDRYFNFVRVKEFENSFSGGNFKAKIKLEVPDGTSINIEKTITGAHGNTGSSINLKPTIKYRSNVNGELRINEEILGQELVVLDNRIKSGDNITIDTSRKTVEIDGTGDISENVDFNSSWFRLKHEYNFTTATGTILSVEYYVRR